MKKTGCLLFSLAICFGGGLFAKNKVLVGGHHLFYELQGKGTPLVIIDVGVGESVQSWSSVIAGISKMTSILVYDRAGYGQSEMGPLPRDAKSEANDLVALLRNAKIPGPYVLVGHSLGGLNMQVFAHEYPGSVVGLVLLDPPPREWIAGGAFPRLKDSFFQAIKQLTKEADEAERSDNDSGRSRAPFLRTVVSEHAEIFGNTARQINSIASFGNLRLIVIASGIPNPAFGEEADAWHKYWIEESRKLSRLSTAGEFVLAERSGHHIHRDAPELVLAAINKLVMPSPKGSDGGSFSRQERIGDAMVLTHVISHGLFYGVLVTGYLLLVIITISPRVWGYKDYPDIVKRKVPVQTRKEKTLAVILGLPWFFFVLGFPFFSTFALKSKLGNEISFPTAFLNVVVMFFLATFGDLVLLDWIIVSKITPKFVIIPGTEKEDYKDFSHHYKGHAKATIPIIILGLIIACLVSFL